MGSMLVWGRVEPEIQDHKPKGLVVLGVSGLVRRVNSASTCPRLHSVSGFGSPSPA